MWVTRAKKSALDFIFSAIVQQCSKGLAPKLVDVWLQFGCL